MPILRINEFPQGSGSLTNDDVFLFMDNPAGSGVTKYIPLSELGSVISGGVTPIGAPEWTDNHVYISGDNNSRYLAGDIVYSSGNIYRALFDNESLSVTNSTYWEFLGSGHRINIDGRDIDRIPYPVTDIVAGANVTVLETDGSFTISSSTIATESSSIVTTCHNKTGSTIAKMTVVYIDGGHGNLPTIAKAQASSESASSKTYGITSEEITDDHSGKVVVLGALTGLDTNQFSVSQGTVLYLSPTVAGGLTTTKPSAPNHIVTVGKIIRNHNNQGVIEVNIQNGFEIQELHNVAINNVTHNNILVYNSGTSLWENKNTNIFSNPSGITGASGINNMVQISQANYDALATKDPNTLYFIV